MTRIYIDEGVPLEIDQGANFYLPVQWIQEIEEEEEPIDITGYTAKMQIRSTPASAEVIMELSSAAGTITIDGKDGKMELIASAVVTAALPADFQGVYDLVVTSALGNKEKLLFGTVKVNSGVTK